jgi:serine/threonine-protein kinase
VFCPRCGTQNDEAARFCKSCGSGLVTGAGAPGAADAAEQTLPTEFSEIDVVRQDLRDEYEILDELGRGGMAIVFRAREKQLDREVAIKVLPFSLAFDREFIERFQREARTSAKLEHPSIIPIYRVGRSGRTIYFVMKFLRGKPLSTVLNARGALPPAEIRDMLVDVCRALAYAHRSGVVHRDIKPDNIMFDEHGQAVVTDFGIAKAASGGRLTGTGMAIGTPHYMSPEQAKAQPIDGRSDMYSLGVVAYVCLAGNVPFDGPDSFSIGFKHIQEPLPEPELRTADQHELFGIIRKMMAKTPAERFQTAEEVLAALEGAPVLSRGTGTGAALEPRQRLSSKPTTPIPRVTAGEPAAGTFRPAREPRRSVAGGLGIFVLVVGGLLGGGYFIAQRQGWLPSLARAAPDTTVAGGDTARTAADTGAPADSVTRDSAAAAVADSARRDTARAAPPVVPPGTPGRLLLSGVPRGARVTVDGQPVRGTELSLPPGPHRLVVQATGADPWDQQVLITPGGTHTVEVPRTAAAPRVDPCGEYGPVYNQGNVCWDTRPLPLTATRLPIEPDQPMPRPAILLVKVSREGETIEARLFGASNVETFNLRALDLARAIRWNPAQKNGEPVEAWVQWQFVPERTP